MSRASRLLASGLFVMLLSVGTAYSQGSQTGGITGVVSDPQGALVKGRHGGHHRREHWQDYAKRHNW
jgi:hypothetical protein